MKLRCGFLIVNKQAKISLPEGNPDPIISTLVTENATVSLLRGIDCRYEANTEARYVTRCSGFFCLLLDILLPFSHFPEEREGNSVRNNSFALACLGSQQPIVPDRPTHDLHPRIVRQNLVSLLQRKFVDYPAN